MSSIVAFIERKDIAFFYLVNRKLRCRTLSSFMKTVTLAGSTAFAVATAVFFLLYNRYTGVMISANLILGQAVIQSLKRAVNRPRPYKTINWVIALKPPKCRYSFPSGHSSSCLALALTVSVFFPFMRLVFFSLALMAGISRIYLGFHYPTDVMVGFLISIGVFELIGHLLL